MDLIRFVKDLRACFVAVVLRERLLQRSFSFCFLRSIRAGVYHGARMDSFLSLNSFSGAFLLHAVVIASDSKMEALSTLPFFISFSKLLLFNEVKKSVSILEGS